MENNNDNSRPEVKVFAGEAGNEELVVFGSQANGELHYSSNVTAMQSEAYSKGWAAAVVGDNNPLLEDFNSVSYVLSGLIKYLYRNGIARYSAAENYPSGAIVNDGAGGLFLSLSDDNKGHALDDTHYWRNLLADIAVIKEDVDNNTKDIAGLTKASIPIGFVYTQYPGQLAPNQLWPGLTWSNISSNFGGSFFRGEGGQAAAFGSWQAESVPNISGHLGSGGDFESVLGRGAFPGGGVFNTWQTGSFTYNTGNTTGTRMTLDFWASRVHGAYGRRGEVAPANFAVRIWRCVGAVEVASAQAFYQYDNEGLLVAKRNLIADEAGYIGYNEANMTELAPPPQAKDGKICYFNQDDGKWCSCTDYRGQDVYHKQTLQSRRIHKLGDGPSGEETLQSPQGIAFAKWSAELDKWVADEEQAQKQKLIEELDLLREEVINEMLLQNPEYLAKLKKLKENEQ